MNEIQIWKPVEFNSAWLEVDTSRLDKILPEWLQQREDFAQNDDTYAIFLEQMKRKHVVETGMLEGLYAIDRGTTETLIKDGFVGDYITHGSSTIQKNELMDYLKVQLEALDNIFDFIKGNRSLSISYIKQLHQLLTQTQPHTEAVDQFGNKHVIELLKGEFKQQENYPVRGGKKFLYCPVLQTTQEMENLVNIFLSERFKAAHAIIKAAWLHHAFSIIHPFQDGNGRMARLLASLVLIQENLFPLTIKSINRKQYIDALEQADKGEYQALIDSFIDDQLENISEIKLAIAGKSLAEKIEDKEIFCRVFDQEVEKALVKLRSSALGKQASVNFGHSETRSDSEYMKSIEVRFLDNRFEVIFFSNGVNLFAELFSHKSKNSTKLCNCSIESPEKNIATFIGNSIIKALERIHRLI